MKVFFMIADEAGECDVCAEIVPLTALTPSNSIMGVHGPLMICADRAGCRVRVHRRYHGMIGSRSCRMCMFGTNIVTRHYVPIPQIMELLRPVGSW